MSQASAFRDRRLRTYRDATGYLESLVRTPPRTRSEREILGLTPIESLLDRIGNPHLGIAAIHITGSKGKGSTALHAEALLTAAGIRVGTFTSPHLEDWTERIRVRGSPIDRSAFVEALEQVRPAIELLHELDADTAPAFFDALVAAAFSVFAAASVDVAVVEAGIGARLDPTRVCRAVATCITGIELEHVDRLGPTVTDIAREKAAIARPGVPLVVGRMQDAARRVVERAAAGAGAPLRRLGRDFSIRIDSARLPPGPVRRYPPDHDSCPRTRDRARSVAGPAEVRLANRAIPVSLRQSGRHMLENAAIALALAHEIGALDRLDDMAAGATLAGTVLPGRMEVLREAPFVIADGAHTSESVAALVRVIEARHPARLVAVVSVTRGKDAGRVLAPLVQRAHAVFATAAEPSRSLRADVLGQALRQVAPSTAISAIDTPAHAFRAAFDAAGQAGMICVTGSMYMAGAARRVLGKEDSTS